MRILEKMAKAKEEINTEALVSDKKKVSKSALGVAIFSVVVVGAGYFLWQNPQIVDNVKAFFIKEASDDGKTNQEKEIISLRQEIDYLKNQISLLQRVQAEKEDMSSLEEKFANLEKTNNAIIDSKADTAAVLGLVTRVDKAEQRLDDLSKITDKGAVVLTAAMLVKDSAERGGSFVYEAEILQQLAGDNVKLKNQMAIINKYAESGIENNVSLIKSFKKVYIELVQKQKEDDEKTWKDRINNKIREYIKVKRNNEKKAEPVEYIELEKIREDVFSGNLKKALINLQNINNNVLLENESLREWQSKAQAKVEFSNAIAEISTYYLAALRINFIVKEIKHD